jgi:hypothetical protein
VSQGLSLATADYPAKVLNKRLSYYRLLFDPELSSSSTRAEGQAKTEVMVALLAHRWARVVLRLCLQVVNMVQMLPSVLTTLRCSHVKAALLAHRCVQVLLVQPGDLCGAVWCARAEGQAKTEVMVALLAHRCEGFRGGCCVAGAVQELRCANVFCNAAQAVHGRTAGTQL